MKEIDQRPIDARVFDALDAATRAVAGLQSVDDVLQVIVDQVRPLTDARYAALGIVNGSGVIERFITSGIDAETRARIGAFPRGHGFLGLIVRENQSIRIPDIGIDERRYGFPPHHPPMRSFLGVPVAIQGRSVGNLYLTDRAGGQPFTAGDQELVETFARHAAIAIENARLHEQVQRLAVVDERERISQDLHDGIIQSLYAVGLSLEDVPDLMDDDPQEVVQRVERAIDSLNLTIADIRNFIFGLRPGALTGTSLVSGLMALAEEFRHNTMIDLEIDVGDLDPETSATERAHLLGVANEALSNIARHSGASRAMIRLENDDRAMVLTISDNGTGFEASAASDFGHRGLANMRSRSEAIHATIGIDGGPDGTTVRVTRPKEAAAP